MLRDLRTAWSAINAHRWFSLAIVAILALGIGINTTVFTLVNAVLFKAMPFRDGERLVTVGGQRRTGGGDGISRLDFLDYRTQSTSFELLEAVTTLGNATLSETGIPAERYRLAMVTSGFFRAFRVEPILGRALQTGDEEPGAAGVVVLGYDVWRVRYQSSPDVIGRAVRLNEKPATIVGVMPRGLKIPNREDLWSAYNPGPPDRDNRQARPLMLVGLLKPSVTVGMASTDLDLIARRLEAAYPETNKDLGVRLQTFNERYNGEEIKTLFLMMLGAVFFVLLITCANVANMLLGRAIARHREMSIRAALGASRWQIVRQLLVESLVLSFLGGLAGLGLATLGVSAFDAATADVGKPSWILFEIDYLVVAYFVLICAVAAVAFGLAPALRSARVDLNDALKDGGRGGSGRGSRLSGVLVVAQFTLAVALLAGAGLLMRSFVAQSMINRWMPRESTMTARVGLPVERYADKAARARFFDDLEARLGRVPGATHATLVSIAPGLGADYRRVELEGRLVDKPADRISMPMVVASPSFFAAFDLSIPRGRGFDERDGIAGREAAVVTAKFASTHWPGEDPIGKRFRFNAEQTPGPWIPVVGVSRDLQQSGNRSADVTGEAGHLRPAAAGGVPQLHHRPADGRRRVAAGRGAAAGSAGDGRGPGAGRCRDVRIAAGAAAVGLRRVRIAVRRLRPGRAADGRRRALCRRVAEHRAAHAGDRHPHRPRRHAAPHCLDRHAPRRHAVAHRSRARSRRRGRTHRADVRGALRCRSARPAGVRRRVAGPAGRRRARLLAARQARRARGAGDRARARREGLSLVRSSLDARDARRPQGLSARLARGDQLGTARLVRALADLEQTRVERRGFLRLATALGRARGAVDRAEPVRFPLQRGLEFDEGVGRLVHLEQHLAPGVRAPA